MNEIKPKKAFFLQEEEQWEQVEPKIQRQVHGTDDKIMLVKVKFEEGGIGQLHEHYHSQVTYVASGEFEMAIGDQVRTVKAGDSFYVPPNVKHGCICKKDGMLIDVFSPHREDFLSK